MSDSLIKAMSRLLEKSEEMTFDAVSNNVALLLVREAIARLGWSRMSYRCKKCGFEWRVWCSLGVEGPPELRELGLYVASPFSGGVCPAWPSMQACGGTMAHVDFGSDEEFAPELIPDDEPRFVLPYASFRGDSGARLEIPEPALIAARRHGNEAEAEGE